MKDESIRSDSALRLPEEALESRSIMIHRPIMSSAMTLLARLSGRVRVAGRVRLLLAAMMSLALTAAADPDVVGINLPAPDVSKYFVPGTELRILSPKAFQSLIGRRATRRRRQAADAFAPAGSGPAPRPMDRRRVDRPERTGSGRLGGRSLGIRPGSLDPSDPLRVELGENAGRTSRRHGGLGAGRVAPRTDPHHQLGNERAAPIPGARFHARPSRRCDHSPGAGPPPRMGRLGPAWRTPSAAGRRGSPTRALGNRGRVRPLRHRGAGDAGAGPVDPLARRPG